MSDLWRLPAHELSRLLEAREIKAVEVAESVISRTDAVEGQIDAYLHRTDDELLRVAKETDAKRASGDDVGPLAGIPVALKDIFTTTGVPTTAGSKILDGWKPPYNSTVGTRLNEAGAGLTGKTNMDEFAMGSSCENSAFKPTRNPWDVSKVPGGSSGGSAAAVAAGMAPISVGTDTGGSIRQPASLCGIVGVKPSYGRVSRYGMIAFSSSLDQAGPFARNVRDAAFATQIISGHDPRDTTSVNSDVGDYVAALEDGISGLKFGVIKEMIAEGVQPGVRQRFTEACETITALGGEVQEISVPWTRYGLDAYYLIAPAEASSNLARYDGMRYGLRIEEADVSSTNRATREAGFGPEVKRRILLGTYALSSGYYDAWYGQAHKIRTRIIQDFTYAYTQVDCLLSPTSPTTAFSIGERVDDPLAMYLSDVCTIPTNLSGDCAISIPCGLSDDGLPVGLQIMAPAMREDLMFRVAGAVEDALGFDYTEAFNRTPTS